MGTDRRSTAAAGESEGVQAADGPGIAPGKLDFTLSDSTGNVWTARADSPK